MLLCFLASRFSPHLAPQSPGEGRRDQAGDAQRSAS